MSRSRKIFLTAILLTAAAIVGAAVGGFIALTSDLPEIQALENFKPSSISRIYSAENVLLAELFAEKRDPIPLDEIPEFLKSGVVATEDRTFYSHSGVDVRGVLRAFIRNILAGEYVEGASTITQQLAKTLFLNPEKTLTRKLKEAFLAFQLERRYTKKEILEFYLNQVYFGSGAYGVESAARIFFGKTVKELTLSECALISGMPKAPSRYSPFVSMDLALKRRNTVLLQMQKNGLIDENTYRKALDEPLRLQGRRRSTVKAPYFIEFIKPELESAIGSTPLYREGLVITTPLSYRLQEAAEAAVAGGLLQLEDRMKKRGIAAPSPQAALIAIDLQTGGILAMVGGRDFHDSSFNRAVSARRQPGSAFKPIAYALAVENGFSQNRLLADTPLTFRGATPEQDWSPVNFSGTYKGEMTLRQALVVSQNIPAVRLAEMLGPEAIGNFARQLGIESALTPNMTLVLGSSGVTLIELTAAYTVFPNKGEWVEPWGIIEINDRSGRVLQRTVPRRKVVMSRSGAAVMTNLLQAVIQEGTGRKALVLDGPVAGKTGTTNDFKDALFVGFSPTMAAGVWVGVDDYTTLGKGETGASAALPIWIDFMRAAMNEGAPQYFDIPDDVVTIRMDPDTGSVVPADWPQAVTAFFKKGTEP